MSGVRTAVTALALVVALVGCGAGTSEPARAPSTAVSPAAVERVVSEPVGRARASVPVVRARPQYLTRSYRSPVAAHQRPSVGRLRIPSLRIDAPVDAVGLDRGVMAIPDSPARIGWLRTTAARADRIGASVLSGHVSDRHDVPGVLSRLGGVRRGAEISWTGPGGDRHRFVVTGIARYPRTRGVPARLFRVTGPRVLHLVTCADRVETSGGGFHYTANLVVTAREVYD